MKAKPTAEFALRSLLVGILVGALCAALAQLAQAITGHSNTFIIFYCAVVAIEAHWSYWYITERLPQSFDRHWLRGGELGLLLVVGLFSDLIFAGQGLAVSTLTTLSMRTIVIIFLILAAWGASTMTAGEFARLGEPPERDPNYVAPLESLTRNFFSGGALLLIVVGLTAVAPDQLLQVRRSAITGPIGTALLYFTLGMVLLALAHHTILARRWQEEGIAVRTPIGPRWVNFSTILMGIAAALAFILPTAYGLGLLDLLALLLQGLIYLLTALGFGVVAPLAWLLALLSGNNTTTTPEAPAAPPPPPPPPATTDSLAWLEFVRWGILAVVVLGLVIWFVRGWLENRQLITASLGRLRLMGLFKQFFQALWARLHGFADTISERLNVARANRAGATSSNGRRRLLRRPRADTPRDQILRYYHSLTERAAAEGLPRRPTQTPAEFAETVTEQIPATTADLDALTAAFIEARYSPHEITPANQTAARGYWEHLRSILRQHRQQAADQTQPPPAD